MLQDPLALLSESDESESERGPDKQNGSDKAEKAEGSGSADGESSEVVGEGALDPPPKRQRHRSPSPAIARNGAPTATVLFEDLQSAGYKPTELLESTSYLREAEGQEARRALLHPSPSTVEDDAESKQQHADASEGEEEKEVEAGCARAPPSVRVSGAGQVPPPWRSFGGQTAADGGGLPPELREPLAGAGFEEPTPIQAYAWPVLWSGRDVIGIAQTGSGKTLAYLLPCFAQLLRPGAKVKLITPGSPPILVLAPTRELVCQIEQEAERFRRTTDISVATVYGGAATAPQLAGLRAQPHLVVATPGRLNDFLETSQASCSVRGVRFLVLDEADRMLDDGFEPQIRRIVEAASLPQRQTILFSATWPEHVRHVAADFLRDPVEIRVGDTDVLRVNPDISQDVVFLEDESEKAEALVGILRGRPRARALVFVATKRACKELARCCRGRMPGRCDAIHGDRSQQEREAALQAFRDGEVRVLFATDVAGRGLDVRGVSLVINFDPPRSAEDYVHRIGRTGRAGETGLALSILTWADSEAARYIADVIRRTGIAMPKALQQLLPARETALDRRRKAAIVCKARQAEVMSQIAAIESKRQELWSSKVRDRNSVS